MCVGEETSKGAHVWSNQAEIDDSLHPWPLLPIKWQFIVQAMWQNQFPFWQLIEIDRLIKQRMRGEQLRRTRRKRTWRRTKVAANTCGALHKQNHCLINSYFLKLFFLIFIQITLLDGLILSFSQKSWKPASRPEQIHHFLHLLIGKGRENRLLFWKLILHDSSILTPLRDTLFLWLVWLRERKLPKKTKQDLLSFVTAKGLRAPWGGEFTEPTVR